VNHSSGSTTVEHGVAAEPSATGEPAAPPPGNVSSWPLAVLAVLAVIWMLHWAQVVLIPITLGVLISYALSPLVNRLNHWRIPRAIGAAVLLLGIVGGVGSLAFSLGDEAAAVIDTLPEAARNFRATLRKEGVTSTVAIEQMQQAANQLERAAKETGVQKTGARVSIRRQIEKPANIQEFLWKGTLGAVATGQAGAVLFLVLFLTVGDTFRQNWSRSPPDVSKEEDHHPGPMKYEPDPAVPVADCHQRPGGIATWSPSSGSG
jgi:hypothetical protein